MQKRSHNNKKIKIIKDRNNSTKSFISLIIITSSFLIILTSKLSTQLPKYAEMKELPVQLMFSIIEILLFAYLFFNKKANFASNLNIFNLRHCVIA